MPLEAMPSSAGGLPPGRTASASLVHVPWPWLICILCLLFSGGKTHVAHDLIVAPYWYCNPLSSDGLDHDRPGGAINRHAAAARTPLGCARHAHHRRDAISAV